MYIRRAISADAANLAVMAERIFTRTFAPDNNPEDVAAYTSTAFGEAAQARELADPDTVYLLVEIDGSLCAFSQLMRGATHPAVIGDAPVEIQRLYVDHEFHGSGVAARLLEACIDTARELGGHTLWLGVWEKNGRAIRFYEKCGLRDVGSQLFMLGNDAQTDRVMSRSLL